MFTKKESLYINAIKSDAQLKLDYKRLSNEQVVSMANSVFPVDNHMLPSEIAQKLNASQAQIDNTYISTLLISDTTKLVPKGLADKLTDCEVANFNNELDIVVLKTTLFETQDYFSKTGIDYIYSLFHVMNLHIEKTVCKNELLMFVCNEKAFILILDKASDLNKRSCHRKQNNAKGRYQNDQLGHIFDRKSTQQEVQTLQDLPPAVVN